MNTSSTLPSQPTDADTKPRPARTPAEWTTFLVSSGLLLVIVGLVLYDWVRTPPSPPHLRVMQGDVWQTDDQFYVPFTVENAGGDTVESVQVIAELRIDGQVVADGEQQIDFLAGGETAEGAFIFTHDPAMGQLTLRVASYKLP